MSLRFSVPHVVAAVFIAVAAAGCSSASTQPQVAALSASAASAGSPASASPGALASSSPGTSASAVTFTSSRPRERLDETPAQTEALYAPWDECMTAHGAGTGAASTQATQAAAQGGGPMGSIDNFPHATQADRAACLHLEPLPPWQYDPANPKAMGFVQRVVACLHQHGVQYAQVVPTSGRIEIALGGPQNNGASVGAGLQLVPTCDQQVLRENVSSTSP